MNKVSNKFHFLIILSSLILAFGIACGLIFEFTSTGFFNFGGDLGEYKSVTVTYALADLNEDFSEETIEKTCQEVFNKNGVNSAVTLTADNLKGGEFVFKFSKYTDLQTLQTCADEIKVAFGANMESGLTTVEASKVTASRSAVKAMVACIIGVSVAIVVQFVYFIFRYKLTMAIGAFIANLHNLLIFAAVLAITRVEVTSSVIAFAALTVFATMVGAALLFDKIRAQFKNEENKKLSAEQLVDMGTAQAFVPVAAIYIALAVAACLIAVATMLGSLSFASLLMPALTVIISFAACLYGTAVFTPSVYSKFAKWLKA